MASSVGMLALGIFLGVMGGYIFHGSIANLLQRAQGSGLGAAGYAYQGKASCGCGRH